MPAGDAQRAWFAEMLEELEQFWDPEIPWSVMISFCARMTEFRTELKQAKGIKPLRFDCSGCGGKHTMSIPPISLRSALFALKNLNLINEAEFKALDRSWARYRKEKDLDAYGDLSQIDNESAGNCKTD